MTVTTHALLEKIVLWSEESHHADALTLAQLDQDVPIESTPALVTTTAQPTQSAKMELTERPASVTLASQPSMTPMVDKPVLSRIHVNATTHVTKDNNVPWSTELHLVDAQILACLDQLALTRS